MASEMYDLLSSASPIGFLVALGVVIGACIRGLHAIGESRSRGRNEFISQWSNKPIGGDELWLGTTIRHCFGEYLPTPLIKRCLNSSNPARLLLEVSGMWDQLFYEGGRLHWKRGWRAQRRWRCFEHGVLVTAYFVFGFLAFVFLVPVSNGEVGLWSLSSLFGFNCSLLALAMLARQIAMSDAQDSIRRIRAIAPELVHAEEQMGWLWRQIYRGYRSLISARSLPEGRG